MAILRQNTGPLTKMSKPYKPVHPRQAPVPVPPGEVVEYDIEMMSISNVFQQGHCMQLIIRNQDDLLSRVGLNGRYRLPFMRTVTHEIHFGNSHLLLPVIPSKLKCRAYRGPAFLFMSQHRV